MDFDHHLADMSNIYRDIAIGPKIWVILGEILHIYYI